MTQIVALILLICTAICSAAFAQSGGLEVFPQSIEMQFPDGYEVRDEAGKVLKRNAGPTAATIKAKSSGKVFAAGDVYLSDWSYDRVQAGEKANWIVPKGNTAKSKVSQPPKSIGASDGLDIYALPREVKFRDGYKVFSDEGKLIKVVPGASSATLRAESSTKFPSEGAVYLSDWSYEQLQMGKRPNWIIPSGSAETLPSVAERTTTNLSKMVQFPINVCFHRTTTPFFEGYDLFDGSGQLLKSVGKSTWVQTEGFSENMPFAGGRAYLAESSIARILAGQPPLWIRGRERPNPAVSQPTHDLLQPAPSVGLATDRIVELFNKTIESGGEQDGDSIAPAVGGSTGRGMKVAGISNRVDGPSSHGMLYPDPVAAVFPYGYEVYDSGGNILESVSGPAKVVLRGKVGQASVSEIVRLNNLTRANPEELVRFLGVLPLNCTVSLNSLSDLSPEAARKVVTLMQALGMGSQQGSASLYASRNLELNTLTSLSREAAEALAGFGANMERMRSSLSLKGLRSLDAATASALLRFSGPLFLNWTDEAKDENSQHGGKLQPEVEEHILFLPDSSYEALQTGKSVKWIAIPTEEALFYPSHDDESDQRWSVVDTSIGDAPDSEVDPWSYIDEVNGSAIIYDIVTARHPATRDAFATTGAVYQHREFGNYWETFQIDGFSHSPELASGNLQYLGPATYDAFAMMGKRERNWLNASLPATYQAIADIFREDVKGAQTSEIHHLRNLNATLAGMGEDDLFLQFYRKNFSSERGVEGYVRWADLSADERWALTSPDAQKRPSFYGVRVYAGGRLAGDYPIFGAVDFESFTEVMLRNYTRRKAGLTMDSVDEWLSGFFEAIYKGIFDKIKKHLGGANRIYWQADAYFHLLPLDLIAISCGAKDGLSNIPMIEVADPAALGRGSSFPGNLRELGALLVSNPAYNQGSRQHSGGKTYDDGTARLVSRAFSNRTLLFENLPGADAEVKEVSEKLDSFGAKSVSVLRKEEASEQAILDQLSQAGMAHIATHGFYLDMTLSTDEEGERLLNGLKESANPYFRSGLALAGANATLAEWSKGNVRGSAMDGVLLASEVKDIDLKNLSLLVLSACSTAEGKPVDGKSVASLREAFLQAGVETLVSTLWDIPDDFAAKLMGDFYQRLLAGDAPSVALWHAKKDNFLELRQTTGFAESMIKVAPFVAVTQAAK